MFANRLRQVVRPLGSSMSMGGMGGGLSRPALGSLAASGGPTGPVSTTAAAGTGSTIQTRSYHEAVIDHFKDPRNVGKLDAKKKSVGSALVGKASCGDVIKLQIEVEDGKITDAKFKTFGCGSAIASSSLVTEMVIGKNLDEAAKVKNSDISSHLSLPPVKIHCSVLAEEAIQGAILDYKKKNNLASAEDAAA